ncbi:class IIb bacteriocin, lactobin A/cerein 7B family [Latilactobacillus sakei]|uniref:Bacteriocin-like peptide n=1 Tax=Latilactobacillus sakei TaxID=1599 RepID=Q6KCG5_LATSK|nr:class IIb bacteriocin, lactobin A/cerein 7B family [Latilactobacillus sakei]MCM1636689.1 class IIb bacteriocin, lactobin A/cerein 7B family [Latilactobacillus sakei]RFN55743.1 class IIb bacteriocin, lactobin A/cerein 7B family [Latilactobacillus sakei]UNC18464.1 class IIb bacteriocin, lactobin A/cerein 7B family [Latilactobacillus sakei]CAF25005.1 bacteriocin-like peptide [Latilactobacillus sakei]SOB37676.1 Bacteriocin-like peptide [Latilactobacillus sakei]
MTNKFKQVTSFKELKLNEVSSIKGGFSPIGIAYNVAHSLWKHRGSFQSGYQKGWKNI